MGRKSSVTKGTPVSNLAPHPNQWLKSHVSSPYVVIKGGRDEYYKTCIEDFINVSPNKHTAQQKTKISDVNVEVDH